MDGSLINILNGSVPFWVLKGTVPASLDFDFANGRYYQQGLSPSPTVGTVITTSRASTGYAADTNGNYSSFANNVGRITNQGLLVEEARTNLILQSNNLATSPWLASNAAALSAQINGPDGTLSASSFADTTANTTHSIQQSIATLAGSSSISFFVKPAALTWATVQINTASGFSAQYFNMTGAGVLGTNQLLAGSAAIASASITAYANGWYRLSVVGTANAPTLFLISSASGDLGRSYVGTGAVSFYVWDAQGESGNAFPGSPIITTTAAVTRAADVVTVTTLPGTVNNGQGTIFEDLIFGGTSSSLSGFAGLAGASADTDFIIPTFVNGTTNGTRLPFIKVAGTVTSASEIVAGTYVAASEYKLGSAWASGRLAGAFDGATSGSGTYSSLPTITKIQLGGSVGFQNTISRYIKRFVYFPTFQSAATLGSLTH